MTMVHIVLFKISSSLDDAELFKVNTVDRTIHPYL
jgi:hypothetical protein